MELEDNLILHLGDPTQYEDEIFTINYLENRPYEHFDDVQIAIAIQMNLSRIFVDRDVYNFLDFIGDIGGLQSALLSFFGFCFFFCSMNAFDNFLVQHLFTAEKLDGIK